MNATNPTNPWHDASSTDGPRHVLPMRGSRRPDSLGGLLRTIADDVTFSRRARHLPEVAISLDVGSGHEPTVDAEMLCSGLAPLVRAACDAAYGAAPASDAPPMCEVVVTVVATPRGLEIEVASSGPGPECLSSFDLAPARELTDHFGGHIEVIACPEGGTAVTLCLPSRRAIGLSVRPAA